MTLSAQETILSKICIFCVQNFTAMGLVNEMGNVPWKYTFKICLLRNALSSANFRIAHLGPWVSAMMSQSRLAFLKLALKKSLFSAKFDHLLYM